MGQEWKMSRRQLDDYFAPVPLKPQIEEEKPAVSFMESIHIRERRQSANEFEAPPSLPPSYFVSATYDGEKAAVLVKLYEPTSKRIYFWHDTSGHKPYLLTNL